MPNPRPIAAFLLEASEINRDFGYELIDRFNECGYEIKSRIYWKERVKNREIQDRKRAESQNLGEES